MRLAQSNAGGLEQVQDQMVGAILTAITIPHTALQEAVIAAPLHLQLHLQRRSNAGGSEQVQEQMLGAILTAITTPHTALQEAVIAAPLHLHLHLQRLRPR